MQDDSLDRFTGQVLRGLYSAALYLLAPITVYHLIWRGFRHRDYFLRWNERYASYARTGHPARRAYSKTVWVHAVSVGEVNAVASLVDALRTRYPRMRVLVTTITPTGSDRVRALWGDAVSHVYLPYDLPGAVARFLEHFQPRLALVVETELWPNLLLGCRDHDVPVYIVNARLSERSLRGYRVLKPLIGRALRTVRGVLAQSTADAGRFLQLGATADRVSVVGNLKYDTPAAGGTPAIAAFASRNVARPVWIAASTHTEEEAAVLAIHRRLRARWPDLLLLWAPRHPERFKPVTQQSVNAGFRVATRRLTQWPDDNDAVFVIDSIGELPSFYACARVAFLGGSLQPVGGHNLLEPASAGSAIVTGPHLHNFSDIAAQLDAVGGLRIGQDAAAVGGWVEALLDDPDERRVMTDAARKFVEQGRGALRRTLEAIAGDLPTTT